MRIILSFNRAAQLDLLLTSLAYNAPPEDTIVIWRASTADYRRGYDLLIAERGTAQTAWVEEQDDFEGRVRAALESPDEHITFLCDDDVLFGKVGDWARPLKRELAFSLRLGLNTTRCYPAGSAQRVPQGLWHWRKAERDFAYAGSLDGHVFRRADVLRMLDGRHFANPTALEDALQAGCLSLADEVPLMACYTRSVLVSIPANRVSGQSQVRHGTREQETAEALNERFLAGDRLTLDGMDFSAVDAAHCELPLVWRSGEVNREDDGADQDAREQYVGEADGHSSGGTR